MSPDGRQPVRSDHTPPAWTAGPWFRLLDAIPDERPVRASGGGRQFTAGPKGLSRP